MKQLPPDVQKEMQQVIDALRAQLASMEKDPEQKKVLAESLKMQHQGDVASYNEALKQWEQDFPPDPNALIAKRLREFLALTENVDFAAKLVQKDGKMRFADASLEQKPGEWKMCFRAGKEATEAARVFAAEWLKEAGGSRK